jgi:hypothetical protein
VGACTAAELCNVASVMALEIGDGNHGVINHCASDSQCPSYSLLIPWDGLAIKDGFCCEDVRAFFTANCAGINQTLLGAYPCQPSSSCVPQYQTPQQTLVAAAPSAAAAPITAPPTLSASATSAAADTDSTTVMTAFKVSVSLSLPVPLAAFNSSVRRSLREGLAIAAGLARGEAGRVQLEVRAARRRLLEGAVAVDATLNLPDATAAGRAAGKLTAESINAELARAGLPAATVTKSAAVISVVAAAAAAPSSLATLVAATAAIAAATLPALW